MENRTVNIKFGIKQLHNGRYAVAYNIKPADWNHQILLGDWSPSLSYKKSDCALKKAEGFVKSLYKDFTDFLGRNVHFTYENIGLVKLG